MFARGMGAVALMIIGGNACSNAEEGSGSAPAISELSYSPSGLTVGTAAAVTGTFAFADPDGDLLELHVALAPPNGPETVFTPSRLAGAADMTSGSLQLAMAVIVPAAGDYTMRVWVRDAAGNDSNVLSGTLHAE